MPKLTPAVLMCTALLSACSMEIENVQSSNLSVAENERFKADVEDTLYGSSPDRRASCARFSHPKPEFCQYPEPPLGYRLEETKKITWSRKHLGDYSKTCGLFFVIRSPGKFEYAFVKYAIHNSFTRTDRDITSKSLGPATLDGSNRPSLDRLCASADKY